MRNLPFAAAGFMAGAVAAAGTLAAAVIHKDPRPSAFFIRGVFSSGGRVRLSTLRRHVRAGGVRAHRGLPYLGRSKRPTLDVFLPENAGGGPLPVVVWVHGGAWISGSKENVAPYLQILAAHGYAVVGAGYSISPEANYPQAVTELNSALAYLREHASDYGIDPDRIVLAGDSAGAQLAAQLALMITDPEYARRTGVVPAAAREHLLGTLLFCGVYDLKAMARLKGAVGWGFRTALWAYTGKKDWARTPAAEHMSILDHVNPDFPPTFISGGNADYLTEQQSKPLADRLEELGVQVVRRFWPKDHKPSLGHEYQFKLELKDSRMVLADTLRFLDTVTGGQSVPVRSELEAAA
ncbi:alpha/beta hydrolase [Arthrobacter sp. Sa2BUA2]|uniref:Alpha/beta hydrolase n=1 Tax=Arthrobacter pullicola TaxID=2762224 RepID=A0ABR8YHF4_9MICC|nr:alpha/beta hydrolase [Arthrobacter pullicola]MBD8043651.1 alpha/beta hydrolase [Arthrobacter pullicola]